MIGVKPALYNLNINIIFYDYFQTKNGYILFFLLNNRYKYIIIVIK